jgi:hypothetical protein
VGLYFLGNEPFWLVEAMTAAGSLHRSGAIARRPPSPVRFSRCSAMMDRRSSWVACGLLRHICSTCSVCSSRSRRAAGGARGHGMSAIEIGQMIGSDKDPQRWSELKVTTAKLQAARAT